MNIHTIITTAAIIIIIGAFAYSGLNIIGAQQLEYRWHNPGQFSFFTMSNHGQMEFCNTNPIWMTFQKFEVGAFYDEKYIGSFTTGPLTLNPGSSTIQEGLFSSEEFVSAQHQFLTLDFEFDGGDIRLDPNKLVVIVAIDTPILSIIPYSSTTQISGFEFDQIMNAEDLSCD